MANSATKSLTITLSTDMPQKRKAQAAALQKEPERQLEPSFNQKSRKNPAVLPTPARVEHSTQLQNSLPVTPPKHIVKKTRRKKSLKALTYKKQQIKTIEATRTVSSTKPHVPPRSETIIFNTTRSKHKSVRHQLPADAPFIKKTHRVPGRSSEPTTTAVLLPATQSDDTLSGTVRKLARPLYKQNPAPLYPRKARRLGYEGIVMLKVLIDENGRVDDLTVIKSSGHTILDRAASSAVRKWLFEPGTEGGIQKKMWVKIPIRFQLE